MFITNNRYIKSYSILVYLIIKFKFITINHYIRLYFILIYQIIKFKFITNNHYNLNFSYFLLFN